MARIQWQTSFEIGITEIDEQHRFFVKLINQLENHIHSPMAEAEAQDVLSQLVRGVIPHFALEEQIMSESQCTFTDQHAVKHQEFLVHLSGLLRRLKKDKIINAMEFLTYLKSWLISHVMREDVKLRRYATPDHTSL